MLQSTTEENVMVLEEDLVVGNDIHDLGEPKDTVEEESPLSKGQMHLAMLAAVALPPLGLLAAMYFLWGGVFSWLNLSMMVALYIATGLGITIGYHRMFTHKAFVTPKPIAIFFMILGGMAAQGPLVWWVGTHRKHHHYSDHDHDPHSPHASRKPGLVGWVVGFMHSHIGWLFSSTGDSNYRYVPDLLADKTIMRVNNLFPVWVALGLAIPAIIGGLVTMSWTGAALGFLWGGLVRMFLLHHSTWSINSICHVWGWRDYRSGDESRNNPVMGILSFGEGWHNNHHAFPSSARHGLKWWQFDASWVIIRSLQIVGLASKVRLPTKERMDARRRNSV